jgi:hypothetical protein
MKRLTILLLLLSSALAFGQNKELTADESIPIPKVEFDVKGDLKITASPNSSPNDFDFLVGKWKMHNRHLDKRLADCHDWTEFDSSDVNEKILNDAADRIPIPRPGFPDWRANFSKGSPCASSIRRRVSGVSTGSRAIRERSIHRSSALSIKTALAISSAKTTQRETDPRRLSLGCAKQTTPDLGSGLLAGQRQNVGMEFL